MRMRIVGADRRSYHLAQPESRVFSDPGLFRRASFVLPTRQHRDSRRASRPRTPRPSLRPDYQEGRTRRADSSAR